MMIPACQSKYSQRHNVIYRMKGSIGQKTLQSPNAGWHTQVKMLCILQMYVYIEGISLQITNLSATLYILGKLVKNQTVIDI